MKFTDDFIPSLFIPLLGLGANNSHVSQRGDLTVPSHNVGNAEDGVRRPRVGQKSTHVDTKSELQEANTCPTPPVLSCSAQATETDTCCVVNPGGVLVHTQFWDLDVGEADSWGIHGLWPDKCNGQYYENCDSGREYSGSQITQALQSAGQSSLLDYMNSNWLSNDESPSDFWAHEWKTHGTCVSTLEPQCFSGYSTAQEVVPYFETVVALFQKFDTYKALTDAGITPSSSATYNLADLQDAVSKSLGYVPDFVCSRGKLSSVQYYLNAQGPLQDGNFVASHASRKSDCPKTGIQWPPKTVDSST
ncbi:ribonuclease T2 [Phellopilus nigrolimitatus]|nr:ribonuclease T2 [Phellopilus nigrolimitatus]